MKALKSKLASELLADPLAREGLRTYLTNKGAVTPDAKAGSFVAKTKKGLLRVHPMIVPKASKAA